MHLAQIGVAAWEKLQDYRCLYTSLMNLNLEFEEIACDVH